MRPIPALSIVSLALAASVPAAAAPEHRPAAIFPVELMDTSGEGATPDQAERLALATETLESLLEVSGRYAKVDLSPYADKVAAAAPRYACNGCWRSVAKEAGAELAVITVVHKISTLKSTVSIHVADLSTDTYIAAADASFRGDDDRAYLRAMKFLVNEQLLRKQ